MPISPLPRYLSRAFRPLTYLMGSNVSQDTTTTTTSPIDSTIPNVPPAAQKAYFAAGCFWGVESAFRRQFRDRGLLDARVGYIGGSSTNPSYRSVCSGNTGHAEAVQILYDPQKVRYEELVEFFYKMHDPCQKDGQGPDRGTQYRSAVFAEDEAQEGVAREVTRRVERSWFVPRREKVVTQVGRAGRWWDAEEYHQKYLDRNPGGYECPSHYVRNFPTVLDTPVGTAEAK